MALVLKIAIAGMTTSGTIADLDAVGARIHDMTPAFKAAGMIALQSVNRNFMEGGRPDRWEPLQTSTLERRLRERSGTNLNPDQRPRFNIYYKRGVNKGRITKKSAGIMAGARLFGIRVSL